MDLVDSIAAATNRDVKWVGGTLKRNLRLSKKLLFRTPSRNSWNILSRKSSNRDKESEHNSIYIIHEQDAESDASKLREGVLQQTNTKHCDVGTPASPEDMEECLQHIESSNYVILLQSRYVLTQEWPLLAMYRASLSDVLTMCVVVDGGGYDFEGAVELLKRLDERLDAATFAKISRALVECTPPKAFEELHATLFSLIPQIISVRFNPSGTRHERAATICDIHEKYEMRERSFKVQGHERPTVLRETTAGHRRMLHNARLSEKHSIDLGETVTV
jgi:hypothetical protein